MANVTYFGQIYTYVPSGETVVIEDDVVPLPVPAMGQKVQIDASNISIVGRVSDLAFNVSMFKQTNGDVNRTFTQVIELS